LTSTLPSPAPKVRIYFLDALRAFAILMMLQGHFTDTVLAPEYRDTSSMLYNIWFFMRGLTAPVFFTVTGIVFVFLLLKDSSPLREHKRVRKGIRRAFFLLALGYLLKMYLPYLMIFKIAPHYITVDVLHVIGLALLALIGIYALHRSTGFSFPLLSGIAGVSVFLVFPVLEQMNWSGAPRLLANYFTQAYGSTFTIFPWLGYALLGGVAGSILHNYSALFKKWWMPVLILAGGLFLHFSSFPIFTNIHAMLDWDLSELWLKKQYLFWRLGHVLMVLSVFVALEQVLKKGFHPLFLKIGSETLTIYAAHYVIVYGTWFGFGFWQFWRHQLAPLPTAIGAVCFVLFFIFVTAYIEKIRHILYVKVPHYTIYLLRWARVLMLRTTHHFLLRYRKEAPILAEIIFFVAYRPLFWLFHELPLARILRRWSAA
jgi:uncharacterized membrane protein